MDKIYTIREQIQTNGFVFLKGDGIFNLTEDAAKGIGDIVKIAGISKVQTLHPTERSHSTKNVYSGNYGLGRFPLHTDLAHWYKPPHYLMLKCISPTTEVYTSLIRAADVFNGLKLSILKRALFQPRRRIEGRLPLFRFYQEVSGQVIYRWDSLFLNAANAEAEVVSERIKSIDINNNHEKFYMKNIGDILIINNWTIFHGRSEVPPLDKKRVIDRVYLSEIY